MHKKVHILVYVLLRHTPKISARDKQTNTRMCPYYMNLMKILFLSHNSHNSQKSHYSNKKK